MIEKAQYKAISLKVVNVLESDVIRRLSKPQIEVLNMDLDRVLQRHNGNVDAVTPVEIEGAYEMVVLHVLPTGSHEHWLK